ncbi:GGDEF domain-containing protein [Stenotrophomonas sp. Betaine-02u-21]|uniref:GGDEF domain-containing protein n=1 Tax=Stenotrophomonas sp. Betaine-02u-21 TaxID=2058301 RepID=UPI000C31E751|nr:GGDEF domain-containing protein [Stenotrophomonas sp. Betaine-02u-21]PKH75318.1 GGDEF domain-containing protein [Stenotrophomonas sp. Betaine-02u-21]
MPARRDSRPAPGTQPGPLALVRAAAVGGDGPRAVTRGGNGLSLQQLFAHASHPESLLAAFADGMATLPGELGDMGDRLQSAQADADWPRYGRAMRQLIDKYIRTIELHAPDAPPDGDRLREQLRQVLGITVAGLLQHDPQLREQAVAQAAAWKQWQPGQPLDALEQGQRELGHQIGVRSEAWQERDELLLGLFDLLLENISELLDDGAWLHGQIDAVRQLLSGPLDTAAVERTRSELRQVIYKQGLLKQSISESKAAMRGLMGDFVQQLDGMANSTGEYHDRISSYALALREARSIADLNQLLQGVLQDTGRVQQQAAQARDHLANARLEVEVAEQRIAQLEQDLREVTDLVRTDPLTGALNRRGLDELLQSELARSGRAGTALAVAVIDLDEFSQTNSQFGHAGGDAVLKHFVSVCQLLLRASDNVARLGGDEFVLVMPDTPGADSMSTLQRLQRSFAQRVLNVQDQRVPVHFSAGLAQWSAGDTAESLLRRADEALYAAKRLGRNRVQAG